MEPTLLEGEPTPDDSMTVAEARERLLRDGREGTRCPCCCRYVKLYKSPFRWSAAIIAIRLARLVRKGGGLLNRVFHLPSVVQEIRLGPKKERAMAVLQCGCRWSPLIQWGLIERVFGKRPDGDWRTGHFRLTRMGYRFALGGVRIPKYVYNYDGRVLGFDGPAITVRKALGLKFDYNELMSG